MLRGKCGFAAQVRGVRTPIEGATVPRDVLDVAVEAARRAGEELAARWGRKPTGLGTKLGPTDLVSDADRAAEARVAEVLARRRPDDGIVAEEGTVDRDGTHRPALGGRPARRHRSTSSPGIPLFCVSIACADSVGTVAGVVFDPVRDELFAGVRGGSLRMDGAVPRPRCRARSTRRSSPAAWRARPTRRPRAPRSSSGGCSCRAGQRRALGSAALELAWTAAGRLDVCFHEQWIHPWDVDAGLFLCQRAGLRVHRLPPLQDGLAPRFLACPEELAAELLVLIGPPRDERRRVAQRPRLAPAAVAEAMRRHGRH